MKNLTYIFAATLFMVACNNEEISSLQDGKNLEVKFTSNLTDYDSQVVSRVNGTSFEPNDQVAIWASSAGTAPFAGKKVLTAGADGKLSSTETFTYKDNNEVSFSALYPASLCTGTDIPSEITLETQTVDGYQTLQDLLYATGKGSAEKPTVALSFSHKGVKIDVAVKQGENITLEGAEVFVKAKSGGVFSFANSSITPTGAEATDIKIPLVIVPDFTNNVNYESTIVAPQTLEGECIGIKLKDATTKYLTYSKIELKEGYRYCFHIDTRKNDVGETEISIADGQVSEEPWLSDAATAGVVEVDEIKQLAPGDNLIKNSDFESGTDSWFSWAEDLTIGQSSQEEGCNSNYSFKITNLLQRNEWEVQVAHDFSEPLIQGATYRLEMDIKGSVAGSIGAALQRIDGYKGAGYFPGINITTEWTHYEDEVVVDGDGADHADRFLFNIGQYEGTIYIDNVKLCQLISE